MVQYDIARPVAGTSIEDWVFDANAAHWLKKALRLQRDLDLDWVAVAMLVDLLRERERLDRENRRLRQRLGRFLADDGQ
jgi:chaperone modulatory protein CbpM